MQISNRFTIGIHVLTAIEFFKNEHDITSSFLSSSVGVNPVVIRTVMQDLKEAGLIKSSQGKTGISLAVPLSKISFYDVYKALHCIEENELFHFHDNPNLSCPVGRTIHKALDSKLYDIQCAMENKMKEIFVSQVYTDISKELETI